MPRITGPNLAEHVSMQRAKVVNAARKLFSQNGYAAVSLADIAGEVGLSRTALYRYFPTKLHILMAWFDQEMDTLIETSRAAVEGAGSPADTLSTWLDVQLNFVLDAEHRALSDATAAVGDLPADIAVHLAERHRHLYATLDGVLESSTPDQQLRRHRLWLIAGLIKSSAESVTRGSAEPVVRAELGRSALAIAKL